jgi:uncharacterized protein GlcG (DUF336 family)
MKRTMLAVAAAAVGAGLTVAVLALPGSATQRTAVGTSVSTDATTTIRILTLGAAQKAAATAVRNCSSRGFAVTAVVVDRDGVEIATLRAEQATGATVPVARGKAYAAAGFRLPTSGLQEAARTQPGLIGLPGFVILPGGEPITVGKQLVGGIGVSGAPSGDIDDMCAQAGLAAIG